MVINRLRDILTDYFTEVSYSRYPLLYLFMGIFFMWAMLLVSVGALLYVFSTKVVLAIAVGLLVAALFIYFCASME